MSTATTAYTLGPLPWSKETLTDAYWKNFLVTQRAIKEHPGRELDDRSRSLSSTLRMFNNAAASFFHHAERFHEQAMHGIIFRRNRRDECRRLEEELQDAVYIFASSAMTLVDQSRALNTLITIPGYAERITTDFKTNSIHRLIQELRVDVVHITLHEPNGHMSTKEDGTWVTKFLLEPDQLTRADKYNKEAKSYLQKNPDGIDLGALFAEYQKLVNEFQEWLQKTIWKLSGAAISAYLECDRYVKVLGLHPSWNIILSHFVSGSRTPYNFLDRFLTPQEMEEVLALPHQSRAQVDRIIQIIDEHGACDDDLRRKTYQAFSVQTE